MAKNSKQKFNDAVRRISEDFKRSFQTNPLFSEAIHRIKQQKGVEDAQEPEAALSDDELPSLHDYGPDKIEFGGLEKHFRTCLDMLSDHSELENCHSWICSTHEWIEKRMLDKTILAVHLSPRTRDIRGWLGYFSQVENFRAYISAVTAAKPIFNAAIKSLKGKYSLPIIIHFRPVKNLYWIYSYTNSTQICLRTPMIALDLKAFSTLADIIFLKKKNQQEIITKMKAEKCLKIQSELIALSNLDLQH